MTRPDLPDWSAIDTVLLDLDGTLLDLAFDTRFWRHTIPLAWARAPGHHPRAGARAARTALPRARGHPGLVQRGILEPGA